jgi:chromosome segregation ATPase
VSGLITKRLRFFVYAILAVELVAVMVGCGGSKHRNVSIEAGEYYSEDELASLSSGRRSDYCKQLTSELGAAEQDHQRVQTEIQDTKDLIQSIRRQIVPIEQEVLQLESAIRTVTDEIEAVKSLPAEYKIKDGDSLTLISMKEDIFNDIEKWNRIFEANQDKIDDPWFIFPDTVLVIPRDWPTD